MNIRKLITGMIALVGFAGIVVPAHAQYVTLSDSGTISGTEYSLAPVLHSNTVGSDPTGILSTYVVSGDAGNVSNGLTFVFQLAQTPSASADNFQQFDALGFSGYSVQMSYADSLMLSGLATGASGVSAPYAGVLLATGSKAKDNASFNGFSLSNGQSTKFLVVRTNATSAKSYHDTAINGGGHSADSYTASGPVAPEPASFAVFGFVGLGILGLMVRARRGKTQLAV